MTAANSTITNNLANNGRGAGVYNSNYNTLNFISATVNGNSANNEANGIYNGVVSTVINARSTLIGDNNVSNGTSADFKGTAASQGYNLIENANGTTITGTTAGNILGKDPQLTPLRDNGGARQTVAPQPFSPAIDAGDPNNSPATDQRGIARPQDGDFNGSALPDIGAYERQVSAILTVTKNVDTNDGCRNVFSAKNIHQKT